MRIIHRSQRSPEDDTVLMGIHAMERMKTAVIGTGFMGRVHLEALRRVELVDVVAVAGRQLDLAKKLADAFGIAALADYRQLLSDPGIHAVHICTPNGQHYPMVKAAMLAGKHVLCEKPLAVSVTEAEELGQIAKERRLRNCVCHNLRYYPMVQQIRRMREAGDLGDILVVQGTYSQDWMLYQTDWNWRVESKDAGDSRTMADIGSHWFDMAEHLTGLRVHSLCADLQTFHRTRKRPKQAVESFAGKNLPQQDVEDIPVNTEDFGAVLFRMGQDTRGAMTASQVSAGRKNHLNIQIYGTKSSVSWDQERPNELWIGNRNSFNQVVVKDPALLAEPARTYADLPGGHAEGYGDTFKQVFRRFYQSIREPQGHADYPQMSDGLRQMILLQAVLDSSRERAWVEIPD
jgi:predicted dehydrogenase